MAIRIAAVLVLICMVSASAGFARQNRRNSNIDNIGVRDINRGQISIASVEEAFVLGRELAAELEREIQLVTDPTVLDYIDWLGQKLARASDPTGPLRFSVVDSDEVNALSLPGGFIYINTGTILAATSEAELASVIAHQIAHATARHGEELGLKWAIINWRLPEPIPLGFTYLAVLARTGELDRGSPLGPGGRMMPIMFRMFNRKAVEEADFLGAQYLYRAGYDPGAAMRILAKDSPELLTKTPDDKPVLLSERPDAERSLFWTHPSIAARLDAIEATIEAYLPPRELNIVTTDEFRSIQRRLAEENLRR